MAPIALIRDISDLRVLVIGGSGFLGSHVIQGLLEGGAVQVAIVSREPKRLPIDEQFQVRLSYHAANVTDKARLKEIFARVKPHAVIHTAAPYYTDTASTQRHVNVEGTRSLLECSRSCPETLTFVYTSTDSAVVPTQTPLTEEHAELYTETHFPNPYGSTKAIADAMVIAANSKNLMTAVIRIPAIYGENDHNLIPQLVSTVRRNEHKLQIGGNKKLFEFLYVGKAAEAHLLALRALLDPSSAPAVAGEAFFVSDGRPEPLFDFARRCYAAAGSPVEAKDITVIPLCVLQAAASAGEWAYWIFTLGQKQPNLRRQSVDHIDRGVCWSIEKAKQRLGYEPVGDQDAAIKRSMDWAASQ